jgi:hypothetical protein
MEDCAMFDAGLPPKKKARPKAIAPAVLPLPARNPLDEQVRKGETNGDIEHDDKVEAEAVVNLLTEVGRQAERVMGNGYWTALVFPDEATCQKFMRLAGWDEHSEGLGAYVDGLAVAKLMGVELGPIEPIRFKSRRSDKRLVKDVGVYEPEKGS